MVGKSLDTGSRVKNNLSKHIPQDKLFISESLSFLREIRFHEQEFFAEIPISNIKYYDLSTHNNRFFGRLMISWTMYLPLILQNLKLQKAI